MAKRVLVVGSGGREHALVWALCRSSQAVEVIAAPGNPGMAAEGARIAEGVAASDVDGIVALAVEHGVSLVVVGPEGPLVAGVVDRLAEAGIAGFGPVAAAARLEGSKVYCKQFCIRHGIPTARAAGFDDVEAALAHLDALKAVPVVKADGLAAGKGVVVADSFDEAAAAVESMMVSERFGSAGRRVLIEERLAGAELSVMCFADGTEHRLLPAAVDHKRLHAGDDGPNTGGMGAFQPSPLADESLLAEVSSRIIQPTLEALVAEGCAYRGVLYAGLMLTEGGPKLIEFNCRFGDPETQAVLPLLQSDVVEVLEATATGKLAEVDVRWSAEASATVVMASAGYPYASAPPAEISGLAGVGDDCVVFHAGTGIIDGVLHATGGRVLAVSATAPTLDAAVEAAYGGVAEIRFEGAQFRSDVGRPAAPSRSVER